MLERDQIWAILPERLEQLIADGAFTSNRAVADARGRSGYDVDRGIALIGVDGVITKNGSWCGSSANDVRAALVAAVSDPEVAAIVLLIDSPGGELRGIEELADAVAAADKLKPTYSYAEDQATSAAYYFASQARKIAANRPAALGSIGVYRVLVDSSASAEQAGIKVHVVKSGERKGDGVPGTAIADEALAEAQKMVDAAHDRFVRAVASGRGLSLAKTRELADGRVYLATEAKTLGLIDDVIAFDDFMATLAAKYQKPKSKSQGARAMSEETQATVLPPAAPAAPRAGTFQELKAELVGADAGFLVSQLEANASVDQARRAWMTELNARTQAATKAVDEAKAKADAAAKKPGVEPLGGGGASAAGDAAGGDAISAFEALIDAELRAMGKQADAVPRSNTSFGPRAKATIRASEKHPDAHAAYLAAYNARYRKIYGTRRAARLSPQAAIRIAETAA